MGGKQSSQQPILRSESLLTKIMIGQQKQVIDHIQSERIKVTKPINQMGDTLGHYAAYRNQYEVLKYLIELGDRFETCNSRGLSAIDVAVPSVRQWMYKNRKIS